MSSLRRIWPAFWLAAELLFVLPFGNRVACTQRTLKAAQVEYEETRRRQDSASGPQSASEQTPGALGRVGDELVLLLGCAGRAGVTVRSLACSGVERDSKLSVTVVITADDTGSVIAFLGEVARCLPITISLGRLDFFERSRDVSVRLDWTNAIRGQGQ